MWPVKGQSVPPDWLELEPVRVLYEFDGPCIFICKDRADHRYLAYQCGDDRNEVRYLVVPFDGWEDRLVSGKVNLLDALSRPRAWIFDLNNDWQPIRCWRVDVDDLPARVLPRPGVMLYADLPPVASDIRLRPCSTAVEMEPPAALTADFALTRVFAHA